jgi:ribosomal-protein-alanine N-acetyltransferase
LLEQVLEDARGRSAERVFLEMRYNNPAAEIYRSIGFEPIGRRRDYYRLPDGTKIDAITFACEL